MAAERQVGLDALLQRGEPQLLEPRGLGLREGLVGEVRERRPAPQRERLAEQRARLARVAGVSAAPSRDSRSNRSSVERVRSTAARSPARASRSAPCRAPCAARDVDLQRLGRCRRRPLAPQLVDEPVAETTWFAWSSRIASTDRGFPGRISTRRAPSTTSSGPRTPIVLHGRDRFYRPRGPAVNCAVAAEARAHTGAPAGSGEVTCNIEQGTTVFVWELSNTCSGVEEPPFFADGEAAQRLCARTGLEFRRVKLDSRWTGARRPSGPTVLGLRHRCTCSCLRTTRSALRPDPALSPPGGALRGSRAAAWAAHRSDRNHLA